MLEKVMELLSAKKKEQLIASLSAEEVKGLFPQIAEMKKRDLQLLYLALGKILGWKDCGEKKTRSYTKRNGRQNAPSANLEVEKPKRTYTRRYKRNAEGNLEKQESTEVA